jgi:hypothetical protein
MILLVKGKGYETMLRNIYCTSIVEPLQLTLQENQVFMAKISGGLGCLYISDGLVRR